MRSSLDKALRKKLETTVEKAREVVEAAVTDALTRLGIADAQAPSYLTDDERKLRNTLRGHARQLGDKLVESVQETESLIDEMAYEHWHRMLFARYLEQNNLLMYEGTPVNLEDCTDLAEEETNCKDGWELAGRLAQKMLPQIFRADSPVFEIKLSINHINTLENLIAELDLATFQAQDSLGWCYQFWQNKKKKQVNESGVRIGAKELSPVTQLFTEPYMVSFLLDNALGAWWAKRRLSSDDLIRANSEQELRELAAIPGVPLEYLRFVEEVEICVNSGEELKKWKSAAGDFDKWPEHLSELKTLDPCCGSGHFLVAVFLMLVPMRMQLEGLTAKEAVNAVLQDNIHGLELDQRCVELAAFALALEAWRYPGAGGYRALPELQLACSGMSINEAQKEWKELAKGDEALTEAITWMQNTFKDASTLGSLIDPGKRLKMGQNPPWELLLKAMKVDSDTFVESKITTNGLAKAATILTGHFSWVITNVPYLVRAKHGDLLSRFLEKRYPVSKQDLATAFVERMLEMSYKNSGVVSAVTPQNWTSQSRYQKFRESIIFKRRLGIVCQLGSGAFSTISGEVVKPLLISIANRDKESYFFGVDVSEEVVLQIRADSLRYIPLLKIDSASQVATSDSRLLLSDNTGGETLELIANAWQGIATSDFPRFGRSFWEMHQVKNGWQFQQSTTEATVHYSGKDKILYWQDGYGDITKVCQKGATFRGTSAWNRKGVAITQMSSLSSSLYNGDIFDNNTAIFTLTDDENLPALWAYCQSGEFAIEVRKIEKKVNVTNSTLNKIPFNSAKWQGIAKKLYPNDLPQPYSNDPIQWIYHGHPCASVIWDEETKTTAVGELRQDDTVLQVAVARLLGYQWPAELDENMELAPEMRRVMLKNADFDGLVDDDGIVCIPAIRGEMNAVKRIEAILQKAYGTKWSSSVEANLLKAVKSTSIDDWLRDKFFEQHCKLFQHRPFIWQIWDGLKDGFSALVNYHKLDYKGLERLIYTYLDDWISTQKRGIADNIDGADIRLTAAENLKVQLEAILEGEALPGKPGLDIFVRWKPLAEQPIGWNPDLNDGVRLNIRPFMYAQDMGKKGAGVLRAAPNIHWKKDRGTDVASAPWFHLGPEYGGKEGDRINDHHLTIAEKKAAREVKEKQDV